MIGYDVKLIEYSKSVDRWNCLTHAAGAFLSVLGAVALITKATSPRHLFSATVYGIALIAVFTVSSVYHGLPQGERKRRARLIDHSTVPLLIAGTATPCAMVSLFEVRVSLGITVMVLAWFCTLFGLFSKIFFFEKLKSVTMAVYIISSVIMLTSVVPVTDKVNMGAFGYLVAGCMFYLAGAVLCGLGAKRPVLHIVFHVFVMIASGIHYYVIYTFIIY